MFNESFSAKSVVFNLIVVNVLFFLATMFTGDYLYKLFALHYFANPDFKPVQIITHMFMHGGFGHIFSNMFALFMFGTMLERVWGPKRFLVFYLITGFGAMLIHTAVQAWIVHNFSGTFFPTAEVASETRGLAEVFFSNTVGASGAVFGILIAFGMLFPNSEIMLLFFPIPMKAKYFVMIYVLWELYRGVTMSQGDNVAHFAHLGGALFGFIIVKIWNRKRDYLY